MTDYTKLVNKDIQFNDLSTNNPTGWSWNFGDNTTSNIKNPVHKYSTLGDYNIKLTASNVCGSCQTKIKTVKIVESLPPSIGSGLLVAGLFGLAIVGVYYISKGKKK